LRPKAQLISASKRRLPHEETILIVSTSPGQRAAFSRRRVPGTPARRAAAMRVRFSRIPGLAYDEIPGDGGPSR
ncbi:MAG TPA: hypothetical protein VE197_14970, partial [Mycobacterium sp.]|nr:hypothetical protein [Mycobacterium sp.]